MDEVLFRGGASLGGWFAASMPLASLRVGPDRLTLVVGPVAVWSFARSEVVGLCFEGRRFVVSTAAAGRVDETFTPLDRPGLEACLATSGWPAVEVGGTPPGIRAKHVLIVLVMVAVAILLLVPFLRLIPVALGRSG